MKAILVFIDGTICDGRQRYHLADTPDFYQQEVMLADLAVPGSVPALQELARRYELVYIGARPESVAPGHRRMVTKSRVSHLEKSCWQKARLNDWRW